MIGELNDTVRALVKQHSLHDIVLAMAHAVSDGEREGILEGSRDAVTDDVKVLLKALGALSKDALRPTGERLAIS